LIGLLFVGEIVWRYLVVLPRVARASPPARPEAA
jgi:hypothetical protein